ncbi:unnamed protein product [Clonostachys rosea]|uniref:Uncharacterized protein n=1 Tax=Bionectria ochroleuca TaxID=29856 RepID=A0ABY6TNM5_BIOOC|nr:unnamed protein product [Clonostachys rosea]
MAGGEPRRFTSDGPPHPSPGRLFSTVGDLTNLRGSIRGWVSPLQLFSVPYNDLISDARSGTAAMIPPSRHSEPPAHGTRTVSRPYDVAMHLDEWMIRAHGCIGSRSSQTTVLVFLLYSARLTSNLLETVAEGAMAVKSAPSLKGGRCAHLARAAGRLGTFALSLAQCSRQALGTIAQALAFGRLWGLLGVYFSLKQLIQPRPSPNVSGDQKKRPYVENTFKIAQLIFLTCYLATDNVSFLSGRKILAISPATRKSLSRWSLRSYALCIAVDIARLITQRLRIGGEAVPGSWRNQFLATLAMFSIALHNSIDNSPLYDITISLLGFLQSGSRMKNLWQDSLLQAGMQDRDQEKLTAVKAP